MFSGMWLDSPMNTNSNVLTTAHMKDGRTIVLRHRNSLGGWVTALEAAGLNIKDISHLTAGLPESARVAR